MLHGLLDTTFFESTLLRVRRLCDKNKLKSVSNDYDVYSLVSILNDMICNSSLLTRENIFAVEKIEYDVENVRKKEEEYIKEQSKNKKRGCFIPTEYDADLIFERHSKLDLLCETTSKDRSPNDNINEAIFKDLIKMVNLETMVIKDYVDKKIAHASTPESELKRSIKSSSIFDIVNAVIKLMKIFNTIQYCILNKGTTLFKFAFESDDFLFEYFDEPLATIEYKSKLKSKWEECEIEFERGNEIDDIMKELSNI